MKFGRVASPEGVGGAVRNTTSLDGSARTAGLTAIRAAKPVAWFPFAVMAPVKGALPSVNSGNCALPLASAVTVAVAAAEFTVVPGPALRTCKMVPDGLENCRPWPPSAALSWLNTAPMPPEKFTPITVAFGSDDGGNGSAP